MKKELLYIETKNSMNIEEKDLIDLKIKKIDQKILSLKYERAHRLNEFKEMLNHYYHRKIEKLLKKREQLLKENEENENRINIPKKTEWYSEDLPF